MIRFRATVLAVAMAWVSVPALADDAGEKRGTRPTTDQVRRTEVSIRGDMFFINGRPTYEGREYDGLKIEGLLMNSRMVQGIFDDLNPETAGAWAYPDTGEWDPERNTGEFVAAMPAWREHGMLSFTLNLQGGMPGEEYPGPRQPWHNSALRSDGSLREDYMSRLERILDRADELGMVPILGIYYFGQDERIEDEAAVIRGVENTVHWVLARGYRNVLIEINNECDIRYDHAILQPERVHELIELAKAITRDGRRLYVSTSYGGATVPRENVVRAADYLLLHGNGVNDPNRIGEMVRQTRRVPGYRPMPILFNEDDHYDFEKPINNYLAALGEYASWGYFDYRRRGEPFEAGYQAVPADWTISHPRKQAFFELTRSITGVGTADDFRIRPYSGNPFYWQVQGRPILLLGASDYHNIFQRPDLVEHLDLMQSAGGNYVRNTMASREIRPDHNDLWPYRIVRHTNDPLINVYDLDQWDEEYWRRFSRMLEETAARNMIVEVELWERHDAYRTRDQAGWLRHPFNPDNNVNYTAEESRLPTGEWTTDPGHPLFATVPRLQNNTLVLRYQEAFIEKVLSYTLQYDHVLYNMNNETKEHHGFGEYWADFVLARARAAGKRIELTDMQDAHDVTDASVTRVMDSDVYTFVDISQNNLQKQETHWARIEHIRGHLRERPRPITNIKIYGSDNAPPPIEFWGNTRDGVERFWRNIFGGGSSARFHRPDWGIGLNEIAQVNVRSMRMLTDAMNVFACEPRNDLLGERSPNEAYCLAEPGRQYAVYFPDGGAVELDVSAAEGTLEVRWLDINRSTWHEPLTIDGGGTVELGTPDTGHWAVLVLAH
jgi:hypothetical protein